MATLKYLLDVTAPDAKKTFDAIGGRLTELDRSLQKTRELSVGDRQAMATFTRLQLQADRLKDRISGMPLTIEGAAKAEAQLLGVEATADRLRSKLDGLGKTGVLSRLASGFDSLVSSVGGLAGAGSALINPITVGLAALAAVMSGPLIASLLPVTIGFAAFAAVAVPAITKVTAARTALTAAEQKYDLATTKAQRAAALKAETAATAGLTASQKKLMGPLGDLGKMFGQLQKAVMPEVLKAFGNGLKVLKDLMPAITPLAQAAGRAVAAFLGSMDQWLKSPSGQKFIRWLQIDGPKDIKTFGKIMWDVAQGIGRTFAFLRNAGDTWWTRFHTLVGYFHTAFEDLLIAWNILRDKVKLVWFQMELDAEHFALSVTTTMGHLPGPLGAPFRKASADIRKSLAGIQQDVRNAAGQIQQDWNALHGKNVQFGFKFQVPGSVLGHKAIPGFAGGTAGAAPGWAWTGERGPELVHFKGGETVVPHHKLPGYALGIGIGDTFSPSVPRFLAEFNRAFANTSSAMVRALGTIARSIVPAGMSGRAPSTSGSVVSWLLQAMRDTSAPASWLPALEQIVSLESGGNPLAHNPSGASGLMQTIPSTYAAYATVPGGIWNPVSNAVAAIRYIMSQYGSPFNIPHLFGGGYQGYDSGGWLKPGWNPPMYNGTGRPEHLVPAGQDHDVNVNVTWEVRAAHGTDMERFIIGLVQNYVTVHGGDAQTALGQRA